TGISTFARTPSARRPCPRTAIAANCVITSPLPPAAALTDLAARLTSALAGRYTIERLLGRGGMATVFLARDVKHDREVAIKVLAPELSAAIPAERFHREIHIQARLHHPHVVTLLDSGEADGLLYYVMTYIEG